MNELFDYGRPDRIRLAALVDRGGRHLPIAADFLGCSIELDSTREVVLERADTDGAALSLRVAPRASAAGD
jgi:pyrimidine operon attenuation protein/uracil phosphoribosyltransferase